MTPVIRQIRDASQPRPSDKGWLLRGVVQFEKFRNRRCPRPLTLSAMAFVPVLPMSYPAVHFAGSLSVRPNI